MEWLTSIRKSIDYMEKRLEEDISAQDVADQVFMSSFFLQKGFSLMTGYGIGEYIRNRRLYKAALDLQDVNTRIFKEWLPGNPDWELCGNASAEWYDCMNGEKTDQDYHSAIWIPVKKK